MHLYRLLFLVIHGLTSNVKCNIILLGINIEFVLKIDDHVAEICEKALKQLAVLKTLQVGIFLIKDGKMVIYNSFVSLNLVIAL